MVCAVGMGGGGVFQFDFRKVVEMHVSGVSHVARIQEEPGCRKVDQYLGHVVVHGIAPDIGRFEGEGVLCLPFGKMERYQIVDLHVFEQQKGSGFIKTGSQFPDPLGKRDEKIRSLVLDESRGFSSCGKPNDPLRLHVKNQPQPGAFNAHQRHRGVGCARLDAERSRKLGGKVVRETGHPVVERDPDKHFLCLSWVQAEVCRRVAQAHPFREGLSDGHMESLLLFRNVVDKQGVCLFPYILTQYNHSQAQLIGGHQKCRAFEGGGQVDASGSLGPDVQSQVKGRLGEHALYLLRGMLRVFIKEQGHRPGHMGRGHGGATHPFVPSPRHGGIGQDARGEHIWFDLLSLGDWSAGTEVRHLIDQVRGPDRDGPGRNAWGAHGIITRACIAGRHHAHHPCQGGIVDGNGHGVVRAAGAADAGIHHIHPVDHALFDAAHDPGGIAVAFGMQHLIAHQAGVRSHSLQLSVGRHDAGHMGAVPVVVHGVAIVVHEVIAAQHLEPRAHAPAQVGVQVVDACVQDGHHHAASGDIVFGPYTVRPDHGHTFVEQGLHLGVAVHRLHIGQLPHPLYYPGICRQGHAVEGDLVGKPDGGFRFPGTLVAPILFGLQPAKVLPEAFMLLPDAPGGLPHGRQAGGLGIGLSLRDLPGQGWGCELHDVLTGGACSLDQGLHQAVARGNLDGNGPFRDEQGGLSAETGDQVTAGRIYGPGAGTGCRHGGRMVNRSVKLGFPVFDDRPAYRFILPGRVVFPSCLRKGLQRGGKKEQNQQHSSKRLLVRQGRSEGVLAGRHGRGC